MNRYRIAFSTMALDGKFPPGDPRWKAFNASFENVELPAPGMAFLIDEGKAFTTCHANGWRANDNYQLGQHLGVDFDTWSVDQAMADPFIERYAAIVYRTPSSTPEKPRSRAVFLLDTPIRQAANYTKAAMALIQVFGGKADAQCKDACRFFYGSLGSMPVQRPLELPLDIVKALIQQREQIQQQTQHRRRTDHVYPRTDEARRAKEMLQRLAPARADSYSDWLEVGMALSTLGDEGLSLWVEWSTRSAKFRHGECERKWRGFDGNGITLATLAHMAREDSPR